MQVLCDLEYYRTRDFSKAKHIAKINWVNSYLLSKPIKGHSSLLEFQPYNIFGVVKHGRDKYITSLYDCQEESIKMANSKERLDSIGKRIRYLREELGISLKEFGEKIGRDKMTIYNYETERRSPDEPTLIAISRTFKVSLEWLKHGTGEMFLPKEELIPTELVAIPVITEAGAGVRYTPDHVLVERSRLKHYKVEAFKVVGDSMMPTIQEGEYVLIDRQDTELYDNAIYLIACQENGIRIRRLRYISGQWWAFADNPKYAPELYLESCKIIGRVVAVYKPAEVKNL